jgi:hypothetical protein
LYFWRLTFIKGNKIYCNLDFETIQFPLSPFEFTYWSVNNHSIPKG